MTYTSFMEEILYRDPRRIFWETRGVLLPVDGSKPAARAATVAFEFVQVTKADLIIMHVINMGTVQQVATMSDTDPFLVMTKYKANGERLLEGYRKAAEDFDIIPELILEKGLPSAKILEVARNSVVDVIIMGSQGYTGQRRSGVGSATERVVRGARCAVLVIK